MQTIDILYSVHYMANKQLKYRGYHVLLDSVNLQQPDSKITRKPEGSWHS